MKNFKKISSVALVVMMFFGGIGHVMAANYTSVRGETTELHKYLVIPSDAEIPEAEFNFSIAAGQAVEATNSTVKVWAGLNPELVKLGDAAGESDGKVAFTAGEAATVENGQEALGDAYVDEKAAKHDLLVDFSEVYFPEPGVYRYLVTEGAQANGAISNDPQPIRTLDVYIEDNNGTLVVAGYVSYEGNVSDPAKVLPSPIAPVDMTEWDQANPAPTKVAQPAAPADPENLTPEEEAAKTAYEAYLAAKATYDANRAAEVARQEAANLAAATAATPNGAEASTPKSNKYVNSLESHNLTFGKEVEGNQGSKDQYFQFTLTINGAGAGTVMTLDMSQAELAPLANSATSHTATAMAEANSVDDDNAQGSEAILYNQADWDAYLAEHNNEEPSWEIGDVKTPAVAAGKAGQQIIANAQGSVTKTFYLKDGQYITVKGLPEGASYSVAETDTAAGYVKTETTSKVARAAEAAVLYSAEEVAAEAALAEQEGRQPAFVAGDVKVPAKPEKLHDDAVSGTMAHEDIFTGWTNTREGVIPTGVMMTIGAPVAMGLIALLYFATKKKSVIE